MARPRLVAWLAVATGALAIWVAVSARFGAETSAAVGLTGAEAPLMLLALAAASYLGGLLLSDHAHLITPVIGVGIILAGIASESVLDTSPEAPPLGYANANAALAVAAVALLLGGVNRWPAGMRTALWVAGSLVTVWTVYIGSSAGAVGAMLVLAAAAVQGRVAPRAAALGAGLLLAAGIGVTALLGALQPPGASELLTGTRLALWSQALTALRAHPIYGLGPGAFADQNLVAGDVDTAKAHSLWLETGAELGFPGLLLAVLCAALVLVVLARSRSSAAVVACGLAAAFGLHACIDYVADFPAVIAVVAFAMGVMAWATEDDGLHLGAALTRIGSGRRDQSAHADQGGQAVQDGQHRQNSSTSPKESRH
ncbi:MAG TPA: O-antigen ligase family protein [Actinomycetales bacterium]|nr:O-antigen ligase family protein [Actinomycetales bacterium]